MRKDPEKTFLAFLRTLFLEYRPSVLRRQVDYGKIGLLGDFKSCFFITE
jgi:hypothetical protein